MKGRKQVFKYDKQNNLYNFVEHDKKGIIAYYHFNYKNNSLIKYDSFSRLRVFNQFELPCKLVHRFEAGESWIRAVATENDQFNLTYPKIKKQFALNNENQIVKFSIKQHVLEQWK